MKLEFKGIITCGDAWRSSDGDDPYGAVRIGEEDFLTQIESSELDGQVNVTLDDVQLTNGIMFYEVGWGYSPWTPMDDDQLTCGGLDILGVLKSREGQEVHLVIEEI